MKQILQKLFPKTCDSIWNEGYEDGLRDGFENYQAAIVNRELFAVPLTPEQALQISSSEGSA